MENLITGAFITAIVTTILLVAAVKFLIGLLIFKWKCKIMANIVAERIREELDDVIDNLEIKMN